MFAGVMVISFVLLGQIDAGGRYPDAGAPNPFTPAGANAATNGASSNPGGTGLVPITGLPSQDNRAAATSGTPNGRGANAYGAPTTPIGAGGTYPPPAVSGATPPPPPSGSPWQVNPSATAGAQASGDMKPAAMMRAMLVAPAVSRLPGSSITLADAVVSGATSRTEQTERVEAYWDLCSSLADYYLGLREQEELRRARGSRSGPTWQQAELELAARVGTAQLAAVASQYRLSSLIGMGGSLPLPADIPHCGAYHTRYDEIFAGRPSAEAQQLAALLPKRFAELQAAGVAVQRAMQWLETTAARDNSDGVETVRALELLALRRRAFVQIARDYNRRIARYTELTTPGQLNPDRLVSMLIKTTSASTATRPGSPASSYNRQTETRPSLPKTFNDEGWTPASGETLGDADLDEAIRQASGEAEAGEGPRRERSLLVNPQ